MLTDLLSGESVRPPYGGHPRLFLWGLLEARLQRADLMILGGLDEGRWPQQQSPDPWLAPGIRRMLGLAAPERPQGAAAHALRSEERRQGKECGGTCRSRGMACL